MQVGQFPFNCSQISVLTRNHANADRIHAKNNMSHTLPRESLLFLKELTLWLLGNFLAFLLLLIIFFSKATLSKNSFRNTIRVSNSLDPGQARLFVGPDLDPNCLQRLSADGKELNQEKTKLTLMTSHPDINREFEKFKNFNECCVMMNIHETNIAHQLAL